MEKLEIEKYALKYTNIDRGYGLTEDDIINCIYEDARLNGNELANLIFLLVKDIKNLQKELREKENEEEL